MFDTSVLQNSIEKITADVAPFAHPVVDWAYDFDYSCADSVEIPLNIGGKEVSFKTFSYRFLLTSIEGPALLPGLVYGFDIVSGMVLYFRTPLHRVNYPLISKLRLQAMDNFGNTVADIFFNANKVKSLISPCYACPDPDPDDPCLALDAVFFDIEVERAVINDIKYSAKAIE